MFFIIIKKICIFFLIVLSFSLGQEYRIGQLNLLQEEHSIKTGLKTGETIQAVQSFEESFTLEEAINPHEYILGPGDELGINILMGENLTLPIKVTPTGDVFIPSVGVVNVSEMTLTEGIVKIKEYILDNAYPNAKVSIALVNIRYFQVQVIGSVNKPGFVRASAVDRLDRIINRAKGFHQLAKEFKIIIKHKNGKEEQVNHLDFIRNGDLSQNPTFLEGDIIFVPFGNVSYESVSLRGAVKGTGYDIIEPEETLLEFLNRRIKFDTYTDLKSILITRDLDKSESFIRVLPNEFSKFNLYGGDIIDILRERGIMVNGFVQKPGAYEFIPGFSISDYISMAGGNTIEGDTKRAVVYHPDGSVENGEDVLLKRGDVIVVPRTYLGVLVGRLSILQMTSYVLTIYMSYLTAMAYL
jgi:protein involved in polysaccharide export with SLBB domain